MTHAPRDWKHEKMRRVAKKYGYELVAKLPTFPSYEGVSASKSMEKDHEKNDEKELLTPQELGKLGNSVTEQGLLIPCPYCKAQGRQNYFVSDIDLAGHVAACHSGSNGYVT